jgi:pimeloyl-ACP methyl ester carboxylesterase
MLDFLLWCKCKLLTPIFLNVSGKNVYYRYTFGHCILNLYLSVMQPLILLHGAIGAAAQLAPLADALSAHYSVHTLHFTGHGGRPYGTEQFSMKLFANDILGFMEEQRLEKASIFGYSMGGFAGMCLAKDHPDKVDKIITLATKYHWDPAIAAKEIQMLNPDKIEQKVPAFAATLRDLHAPNDWKDVLKKTADMMTALGNDNTLKLADHSSISTPALLLLGDRDKMVSLDETVAVYKALPNAQMGILPNTPHPLEQVDTQLLAFFIRRFIG